MPAAEAANPVEAPQPTAEEEKAAPAPAAPPDLKQGTCPDGLLEMGDRPPAGNEHYCVKVADGGGLVRQGPAEQWHTDGSLESKGQFADGVPVGHWESWNDKGRIVATREFELPPPKDGSAAATSSDTQQPG